MGRIIASFFFLSFLAAGAPARALSPMEYYNSLVAGGTEPGFRDGAFFSARFRDPVGLAFGDGGRRLYVADPGNHRIRVVELDRNNDVGTLAGTGVAGDLDGPLSIATFHTPVKIASLPGDRLAVYDDASRSVRLIDLQNKTVSTLAKKIHLLDMVYRPQDDGLYFSDADLKKVEKLDMRSLALSDVLPGGPSLPSPGALCLDPGGLCVADAHLPVICRVPFNDQQIPLGAATPLPAAAPLTVAGLTHEVMALTESDGNLYVLQKDGLLAKVGPAGSGGVQLQSPWGFSFNNLDHQGKYRLFNLRDSSPVGFLASPDEPRKLFISARHFILSVKDYDFEKRWGTHFPTDKGSITDFDYPAKKPERTFRILVIGASRSMRSVPIPPDPASDIDERTDSPRTEVFSKQLEFLLNTDAALRDGKARFEVLNYSQCGEGYISTWIYQDVPGLVGKYDIDLVLELADYTGYQDYYLSPMTPEGIPSSQADPEYRKKPLSERAASPAAKDLLARCKILGIAFSEKQDFPGDGIFGLFGKRDERIHDDLIEMAGRRQRLFSEKLKTMRTLQGTTPQFYIFYVPWANFDNDGIASFWSDLCAHFQLNFFDLTDPYNALKLGYHPTCYLHYTAYGNELIARLLEFYLEEKKIVPLGSP